MKKKVKWMKKPAILLLGLVLALTGCSGGKSKDGDNAKPKDSASPSVAESFPPDVVSAPPKLAHAQNADAAFELTKCPEGPGEVLAEGTLKPTLDARKDYVVTITWTNGGKPVARSSAVIKGAKKGEESSFQIRAALSKKADACSAATTVGKLKG